MKIANIFVAGTVVVAGWGTWAYVLSTRAEARPYVMEPIVHTPYLQSKIDSDIKFHEGRVALDKKGAIGWKMLGDAYLARSNESDMDDFAWKGEDAARKSIQLRSNMNPAAFNLLVKSLLEQHRFQDALGQAKENIRRFPSDPAARRILVDTLIEVGKIDEAAKAIKEIPAQNDPMTVVAAARVARVSGESARSLILLRSALGQLEEIRGVSEPTLAWIHQQIAAVLEDSKDHTGAESELRKALELNPRSYKATLGLARVSMVNAKFEDAIRWANQTLEVANSLDAVAIIGDAKLALGDKVAANVMYAKVLKMYADEDARFEQLGKGGNLKVRPIDRQFATFAATHKMFTDEAVVAAKRDIANRPDNTAQTNLNALQN